MNRLFAELLSIHLKYIHMKKKFLLLIALVFVCGSTLYAQDSEQVIESEKGNLAISGYVDAYYQYNFNDPESGVNKGRVFDLHHNQFSLGLVQAMFTYTKGRLTGVADLTVGPNADLANFGNEGTARLIKQAYISYAISDKVGFTVGQYGTHIGYELIDAPLNFNYSLSYLFGNGPFYHTGAKFDFALSESVGLMVGVVNGWDALVDYNEKKSITAQFSVAPSDEFSLYLNWIGGDEYDVRSPAGNSFFGSTEDSFTSLFDLTTSYQASDAFLIGLNAAYGSFKSGADTPVDGDPYSDDVTWGGAALYLNYATSETFALGFRGEYFSDPDGVRYSGPLEVTAFTFTGDIKLADGSFMIKPEIRMDFAKDEFFEKGDDDTSKSQVTAGAAFIYAF